MSWTTIAAIAVVGATVGFLGGLFGKGGSAIATPLLVAIGIPPFIAIASPLPSTIPATLVAASAYGREQLIDWRVARWSVLVGVPATAFGAYATRWVGGPQLVVATEVIVALLGLRFLLAPGDPHEIAVIPGAFRTRLVVVALAVGLISGLLANGGGFLLAPLYVIVLRLPIKAAFATSLVVAAALAVPGTVVHAALGHIDWTIVAIFGTAAIPLSFVGARVALRTDSSRLERFYGAALLVLGVTTLTLNG
jgi:uncharacterized protein